LNAIADELNVKRKTVGALKHPIGEPSGWDPLDVLLVDVALAHQLGVFAGHASKDLQGHVIGRASLVSFHTYSYNARQN
jgi:hypothetical protein